MTTYIALLRGINVGGNRKIRMADLSALLVEAGCGDVTTYIQSGNAVFTHPSRSPTKLTGDLEDRIAAAHGFDVPVVLRTAAEWVDVIARNPYPDVEPTLLHACFFAGRPDAAALEKVDRAKFEPETFTVSGREIYLHLPNGMGRSKLTVGMNKVLAPATARNWRTVEKLHELAGG